MSSSSFFESVSAELKRIFYQENVYQPELFTVALDPRNIAHIYNVVTTRIQKSIGFDDFLSVSTEVMGANLRNPYRADDLAASVSALNRVWIDLMLKRFASDANGAAAYYRKAAMQNFVQNPSEFQAPVATAIHGHKILVQSVGFGETYENGREASDKIRLQFERV
jgi:hypothetical protein